MGDNNEEIEIDDVVVAQPAAADKNELIMQLMQQIAEMSVEIQRMQDLYNPISSFNPPRDGSPPLHFPPPSTEQVQNLLSNPTENPPTIDLTTPNPRHATTSCQAPHHPQNTNLQILHLLKTKERTMLKPSPIFKTKIPILNHCPKIIKPLKIPRIPPLFNPYLKRLLSKS